MSVPGDRPARETAAENADGATQHEGVLEQALTREPATERYVGDRDLTRWSRLSRGVVDTVLVPTRYVSSHAVLFIAAGIGAVLALILTWASSEIYENVKQANGLAALDEPMLQAAIRLRTPANIAAVGFFTNLGGTIGMSIITLVVLVIMTVVWRSRTPIVLMLIGIAGSLLMTVVGKDLIGRARPPFAEAVPPYEHSYSFPSGHTLNSTVIASLFAYLLLLHLTSLVARILTVVVAVAWFVAMGLSRVFLGHHWFTDVLVGWTLGLAWVAIVITSHRLYLTVRARRGEAASTSSE